MALVRRESIPAAAYLDGGTASLILQFLAAGVLGSLFFIKGIWYRIRDFFISRFGRRPNSGE